MSRPLLVFGATGTLGQAFHRICDTRGLDVRCATRRDFDMLQPSSIAGLIAQIQPWAVINATGYVRVDDAERDAEACFDVNATGAANIASASAQHGVRLVSFSSDLVFDGQQTTPYSEADATRPLNVYGASKAEAERRVLEVMPHALVIRTSAFFGPWDDHNFVVQTLRSLRAGRRTPAADDVVVSPTYVPDLVDATLDLLIDGETGLWHLTNGGSTTWFEFAREAATTCGERADLIERVAGSQLGWTARRPAYSALASVRGTVMRSRESALVSFAQQFQWGDLERLTA